MASLAAEDVLPAPIASATATSVAPLETQVSSIALPASDEQAQHISVSGSNGTAIFDFQDSAYDPVSPKLQNMREFACYLSFYLAGYK